MCDDSSARGSTEKLIKLIVWDLFFIRPDVLICINYLGCVHHVLILRCPVMKTKTIFLENVSKIHLDVYKQILLLENLSEHGGGLCKLQGLLINED